jgi:glycosyltransferase involved in cell wall biosynthesis
VGRVQKWKGAVELCEAILLLGNAAPSVDWIGRDTAFGKPGMTTAGYLRATYPSIWGRGIRHLAALPPADVRDLQAAAAFCLVPSQWDTFNFTCVEAMGTAAPVICSTGAGASELIEDGRNGLLYEAGSAQALANAIKRMLDLSSHEREAMGERARETVAQRLDPATIIERRIDAYERCVAERATAARLPEESWVAQALRPQRDAAHNFEFLHQVPLRELTAHTAKRMIRKVTAGRA